MRTDKGGRMDDAPEIISPVTVSLWVRKKGGHTATAFDIAIVDY